MDTTHNQSTDDDTKTIQPEEQKDVNETPTGDVGGKGGYVGEEMEVDVELDKTQGNDIESDMDDEDAGTVV